MDNVMPPRDLVLKVLGVQPTSSIFWTGGQQAADDVERAVTAAGIRLTDFHKILDFGCGCGRVIIPMVKKVSGDTLLVGTDIDAEMISWCREHLAGARFDLNGHEPPMAYADGFFDFVYALSVFTHLDESHEALWFREVHRLLRPGSLFLFTAHGDRYFHAIPEDKQEIVRRDGFLFTGMVDDWQDHGFPPWYHNSFHLPHYFENHFVDIFELVRFIPKGMNALQDVYMMRRKS